MKKDFNEQDALRAAQIFYPKAERIERNDKGYSHYLFEVETNSLPERVML